MVYLAIYHSSLFNICVFNLLQIARRTLTKDSWQDLADTIKDICILGIFKGYDLLIIVGKESMRGRSKESKNIDIAGQ